MKGVFTSLSPRVMYYFLLLKKRQWIKRQELERIQLKKLKAIIRYAYNHVPYYHKLFNSVKIRPEDIKCQGDLRKIPVTTKADIQRNYSNIIAKGISLTKCRMGTTTGSTGIPLKVFYDNETADYSHALRRYNYFECGLGWRDTLVEFRHVLKAGQPFTTSRFALFRRMQVSLHNPIDINVEIIKQIKPNAICTFPSVLTILAKEVKEKNIQEINPGLIFSEGETLTQHCRDVVQEIFGIDINDTYGSVEFNRLAFECNEHCGLHTITDCAILEFLSGGEAVNFGERGEIVVTGLYNYVMPLVRYKIGDVGIPSDESCSCGRSLPLIKSIEGRNDDFLVLPSGRIISPINVNALEHFSDIFAIIQYQMIQEKRDTIVVKVVKGKGFNEDTVSKIKEIIRTGCLGEEVNIDVQFVNEIPRERTGKIRAVISKVDKPRFI